MRSIYFDVVLWKIALTQILTRFYKDAKWWSLSPIRVGELPEPELAGPEWVKVRVDSCGLCGSDMHLLQIAVNPRVSITAIPGMRRIFLGHEIFGEVVEAGERLRNSTRATR